jgi:hypothetical protein
MYVHLFTCIILCELRIKSSLHAAASAWTSSRIPDVNGRVAPASWLRSLADNSTQLECSPNSSQHHHAPTSNVSVDADFHAQLHTHHECIRDAASNGAWSEDYNTVSQALAPALIRSCQTTWTSCSTKGRMRHARASQSCCSCCARHRCLLLLHLRCVLCCSTVSSLRQSERQCNNPTPQRRQQQTTQRSTQVVGAASSQPSRLQKWRRRCHSSITTLPATLCKEAAPGACCWHCCVALCSAGCEDQGSSTDKQQTEYARPDPNNAMQCCSSVGAS